MTVSVAEDEGGRGGGGSSSTCGGGDDAAGMTAAEKHRANRFGLPAAAAKPLGIDAADAEHVRQLREMVAADLTPYYDTDFNLLRWIQGYRELSLGEVARKLRFHLRTRKSTWEVDEMAGRPREHTIHRHWMYGITGPSRVLDNVIVNVEQLGATDYSGMMDTFSVPEVLKARTHDLEDMLAACMAHEARTGRQASILYVMDMAGLRYDKRLLYLIRGPLRALTEFMATHYVELINSFVLVNVPSCICAIWQLSKSILPERTRQKVRILGGNWREQILDLAHPDVLPVHWNTTTTNNNNNNQSGEADEEHCRHVFKAKLERPPPYPVENYFRNSKRSALLLQQYSAEFERLRVGAGKTTLLTYEVHAGDAFEWFVVAESDFGMGVYYAAHRDADNVDEMTVLFPCQTWMPGGALEVPAHDRVTIGASHTDTADGSGFVKVWLSNQHSWWTTLNVRARFRVIAKSKADSDTCDAVSTSSAG